MVAACRARGCGEGCPCLLCAAGDGWKHTCYLTTLPCFKGRAPQTYPRETGLCKMRGEPHWELVTRRQNLELHFIYHTHDCWEAVMSYGLIVLEDRCILYSLWQRTMASLPLLALLLSSLRCMHKFLHWALPPDSVLRRGSCCGVISLASNWGRFSGDGSPSVIAAAVREQEPKQPGHRERDPSCILSHCAPSSESPRSLQPGAGDHLHLTVFLGGHCLYLFPNH